MDFNNGLYVFNGVPGLEASKGERIAKALQNLQTKIKHLEQVRNLEREASKSGSTDIEDITLSDVRLKLLFLQLQFMRVKLRRTRYGEEESTPVEGNLHEQSESEYCELSDCCKGTQTGISLHENISTIPKSVASPIEEETKHDFTDSQPTAPVKKISDSTTSNFGGNSSKDSEIPSESIPPFSKDVPIHYHLNFDDVPFILGASAFESHNLIANVQNLLAKMKTHNKALCGSRFQAPPNCGNPAVERNCLHTKKMMKEISKDLTEIEKKQIKVIESFDNQDDNHPVKPQVKDIVPHESEVNQKQAKKTSNTNSATTGAAVCTKENKQMKSIRPVKKIKHAVPINKIQPNLPQVARQRLLRSIKTFRTQLSEDDISWD